jgi:hypothetical protein
MSSSSDETVLRVYNALNPHRHPFLNDFWDHTEFITLHDQPTIETWSRAQTLLRRVWLHLPFGRHIEAREYDDLLSNLPTLVESCREQLFVWNAAGPLDAHPPEGPVEAVTIFSKTNFLWFTHLAPIQQQIKEQIRQGNRIRFLERFRLDYEHIDLEFQEIRIAPIQFGTLPALIQTLHRLVICPGREHTFCWTNNYWETSLENPDTSLTNPTDF